MIAENWYPQSLLASKIFDLDQPKIIWEDLMNT